ncbi:MAG: hypothetical protein AW07_04792 [Candidatus Accumulibacter sp. SK-11]|nr:MAG: hypothetical protein AW07_04792 [Candidatus Accumulibacter sp. SK-11]
MAKSVVYGGSTYLSRIFRASSRSRPSSARIASSSAAGSLRSCASTNR